MATTHTTKFKTEDGDWHETKEKVHDDGSSKSVTRNITDRTWFSDEPVESVTETDKHGNSRTEKC